MPWCAVYTYGGAELIAIENLRNQTYRAICPLLEFPNPNLKERRVRPTITRPLFPCYVLLHLEPGQRWSSVNNTRGVIRIVTSKTLTPDEKRWSRYSGDLTPLFLPAGAIDQWLDPTFEECRIKPQTIVRVKNRNHAFYLHQGIVQEMTANDRVRVLMSIFNRDTVIEFASPSDLETVEVRTA